MKYLLIELNGQQFSIPLSHIGRLAQVERPLAEQISRHQQGQVFTLISGVAYRIVCLRRHLFGTPPVLCRGTRLVIPTPCDGHAFLCELVVGIEDVSTTGEIAHQINHRESVILSLRDQRFESSRGVTHG